MRRSRNYSDPTGFDYLALATASSRAGATPRMRSAARSAMAIVGAFVLPRMTLGITEASTTRSAWRPSTRSSASTTEPIAQVPTGW